MIFTPKVSVVIPVYNAGDSLIVNVRSLLEQDLKEIEIILVDDGSTDDSLDAIEWLANNDARIVSVRLTENKGVHEARLAGLKKTTAPWIGFMDADDFARPNMYSSMYESAISQDVDIVVCGSYRVTSAREVITTKTRFSQSEKVDSEVFRRFCDFEFGTGSLCNKLYSRDVIIPYFEMHFPWRQRINEDLLLNIGCFYGAKSVYKSKDILYEYVLNPDGVTSARCASQAYVETYRAAALAISSFYGLGCEAVHQIVDMYRTQLSWKHYLIDCVGSLDAHKDEINEAVELIYTVYPEALGLLVARKESRIKSVPKLERLIKRGLNFFGNN